MLIQYYLLIIIIYMICALFALCILKTLIPFYDKFTCLIYKLFLPNAHLPAFQIWLLTAEILLFIHLFISLKESAIKTINTATSLFEAIHYKNVDDCCDINFDRYDIIEDESSVKGKEYKEHWSNTTWKPIHIHQNKRRL